MYIYILITVVHFALVLHLIPATVTVFPIVSFVLVVRFLNKVPENVRIVHVDWEERNHVRFQWNSDIPTYEKFNTNTAAFV